MNTSPPGNYTIKCLMVNFWSIISGTNQDIFICNISGSGLHKPCLKISIKFVATSGNDAQLCCFHLDYQCEEIKVYMMVNCTYRKLTAWRCWSML